MEEEMLFNFDQEDAVEQSTGQETEDIYGDNFESEEFSHEENSFDYITKLLENRGIKNRTLQVEDEEGNIQNINFDDLSDQEKYDLLSESEEYNGPSDAEIQTLNYLRQNEMSLQDFANWQRQLAIQEYLSEQSSTTEFDSYSDEEIIAYDFIQRFGEYMSDEEIDAEIERLKANPEAFEKRVGLLRNSYKSEEEAQAKLYQEKEQQENEAAMAAFKSAYTDAVGNMNYIHGVDLDENDKNEVLSFVLDKDAAGRTGLSKALENPETVLKMAWYLLHGEETYDATVDYFKKEISKREKSGPRAVSRQSRPSQKDAFKFN